MAKNKKWNKVIARIQALEDALAGLLTGKSKAKRKKTKQAPAKKPAKRKAPAKKAATAQSSTKTRAKKSAAAKPRKRNPRVAAAENAPILPQPPVPSL